MQKNRCSIGKRMCYSLQVEQRNDMLRGLCSEAGGFQKRDFNDPQGAESCDIPPSTRRQPPASLTFQRTSP